jgi:hypothetical protein
MQGVSRRSLEWYSECYCVVSVTKTFTLKGVQTLNVLVTLATHQHLEYHCKALFETLYIVGIKFNIPQLINSLLLPKSSWETLTRLNKPDD